MYKGVVNNFASMQFSARSSRFRDIDPFPIKAKLGLEAILSAILGKISPYQNRVPKLEIISR